MDEWKLHTASEENLFYEYRCGLKAGDRVELVQELVVRYFSGQPTGKVFPIGDVWTVLAGLKSDPVLWLRDSNGDRATWDDDPVVVARWFRRVSEC